MIHLLIYLSLKGSKQSVTTSVLMIGPGNWDRSRKLIETRHTDRPRVESSEVGEYI